MLQAEDGRQLARFSFQNNQEHVVSADGLTQVDFDRWDRSELKAATVAAAAQRDRGDDLER